MFKCSLYNLVIRRLENNDKLMKLHNEIQEQKSKKERAQRELKIARQAAKNKLDNRDFFIGFEVRCRTLIFWFIGINVIMFISIHK